MNYFKDKKNIAILGIIILIIAVIVLAIFLFKDNNQNKVVIPNLKNFKGRIIIDSLKTPNTTSINDNDGEVVPRGEYEVKLQPQSETEEVYISNAKLTLKEAYNSANTEAIKWSNDAKLVFIKSNGALGLDGRSSSWQLVYASDSKNRNYEIIIFEDKIASSKDIDSKVSGFETPVNWYDSYEAIASLRTLPQFSTSTVSAISFYYSNAEKSWAYGIANSDKTTSMWVK